MTKQKKSFLEKIVGAKEKDLEENVNLEQDMEQSKEFSNSQKDKEDLELDDVSKEQIKKDILESEKKHTKENLKKNENKNEDKEEYKEENKWPGSPNSLSNENGEEGQLAIDVYQTDDDIVIKSIVGGVKSEELDISINNDMVTIKGARQNPDKVVSEDYYYQECFWGNFSRSVILPTEVDVENVEAAIKNGILTIKLPRLKKAVARKIRVKSI